MTGPADLTGLFGAPPAGPSQDMRYRQGTVVAFDPVTLQNTVLVGGTVMTDLQLLGVGESTLLTPGAVVGIVRIVADGGGETWAIVGRLVTPNTAQAADAVALLNSSIHADAVSAAEGVTSATYTDLATAGPYVGGVLIGAAGRCLVTVSAEVAVTATTGAAIATGAAMMSFDVSGATTVSALDAWALEGWIRYDASPNSTMAIDTKVACSRTSLVTGLNTGLHGFTAQYRRVTGTSTPTFADRNIVVQSL